MIPARIARLVIIYQLVIIVEVWSTSNTTISDSKNTMYNETITDLRTRAVLFDKGALQLNITWTFDGHGDPNKDKKINVIVKPFRNDNCPVRSCAEYGLSSMITTILIPKDPMPILEHQECTVQPGCTYEIRVETTYGKAFQRLNVTVPDCVGHVCACKHSAELPYVAITARIEMSMLFIAWNLTSDIEQLPTGIQVSNVDVSVGTQKNPSLTWGGQYHNITEYQQSLIDEDGALIETGSHQIELLDPVLPSSRYLVRAYVVDNQGCHGQSGNYTIVVPMRIRNDLGQHGQEEYKWIFSIIFSGSIVVFILIMVFQRVLKRLRKVHALQNWRGVYHNVPTAGTTPHIIMQDNFFYVDKDILEARARGEADMLEVPHACLTIGREIGKGAFGRVFIARADNICGKPGGQVVAVKQLKKRSTPEELEEFLGEIGTMKKVSRHPNVVSLMGCCTIRQPLLMIMEYVGYGDLLQYLRQVRAKHEARSIVVSGVVNPQQNEHNTANNNINVLGPPGKYLELLHSSSSATFNSDDSYVAKTESSSSNLRASMTDTLYTTLSHNPDLASSSCSSLEYVLDHKELHNFAIQISRGMRHLEERQITHRDLAARNILIDFIDDRKTLKISDFGLSRSGIYVNTRNKKVPLRWLSLEAMRDNLYSNKSDVWAFGVVLWEIGTLGGFPYPTVSNHELLAFLATGHRLQRPENCSEELYDLMLMCWAEKPDNRPQFSDIVAKLEPSHQRIYVDFNDLGPDYVFPPTAEDPTIKKREADMTHNKT